MTDQPIDPNATVPAALATSPPKRAPNLDIVCLTLIGTIALADLAAVTWGHVALDSIAELSGPVIAGLMAFLKGT
jgi:hypothetical protein